MPQKRPFSTGWMLASVVVFVLAELFLGGFVADALHGRVISPMGRNIISVSMHLLSYFIGGIVIGVVSPKIRMTEPAAGAFISIGLVMLLAVFLPYTWMRFTLGKFLVAGGISAAIAYSGAQLGERIMGNVDKNGRDVTAGHSGVKVPSFDRDEVS